MESVNRQMKDAKIGKKNPESLAQGFLTLGSKEQI